MFKGFKEFIFRGNVVDLAVAVVIGAAFTQIVNALVKDIITPMIGALGGNPDFSSLTVTINGSVFLVGDFINAVISFAILAAVVYFLIVTPMNHLMTRLKKGEKVDPDTKLCPECLSSIPAKAKRCKDCTAVLKA